VGLVGFILGHWGRLDGKFQFKLGSPQKFRSHLEIFLGSLGKKCLNVLNKQPLEFRFVFQQLFVDDLYFS